ncbi:hypothetical protein [Novosphingobium sp. AP12]|uniref:hypothetical protein n=1 Tax=Novosphingobium sp. AP12 TaxID=1144305 RepID=UPI0012FB82DC|nr:hypothetical protein [Novosphingobium sp. AP12]
MPHFIWVSSADEMQLPFLRSIRPGERQPFGFGFSEIIRKSEQKALFQSEASVPTKFIRVGGYSSVADRGLGCPGISLEFTAAFCELESYYALRHCPKHSILKVIQDRRRIARQTVALADYVPGVSAAAGYQDRDSDTPGLLRSRHSDRSPNHFSFKARREAAADSRRHVSAV